jgi:uncharacterized protein (DUF302 family)
MHGPRLPKEGWTFRRRRATGSNLWNMEDKMSYYLSRRCQHTFESSLERVRVALSEEGFGVLTEIDVKATLKKKLDVDFRNYHILGACNPSFAHRALQTEDKIGTMLPCNVVIQEIGDHEVEIAAIDPVASMQAVDNPELKPLAEQVRAKLGKVVARAAGPL